MNDPKTAGRGKRRDVAWGFFVDDVNGVRDLWSTSTRRVAAELHGIFHGWGRSPGPVFKITEPTAKRGRKGK